MRDRFRGLRLRQAVIHRPIEMAAKLRHLSGGDQSTDRHEAAIARRQVRTQPQITEEDVGRILNESEGYRAELGLHAMRTLGFRRFVKRQEFRRCWRDHVGPDPARAKTSLAGPIAA